jgi:hypothetical protein
MGRRTWIKIFAEKWLRGGIRQESAALRGTFVDLLVMAGDSAYADEGTIRITKGCGLTDGQVCKVLNLSPELWAEHKARLVEIGYVEISEANEITILEWSRFQSDYQRTKDAPSRHRKSTPTSTRESTGKKEKEKEKEKEIQKREVEGEREEAVKTHPCPQVTALVDLWHSTCPALPKITDIGSLRDKARLRLKEHPDPEWWRMVFQKCLASPFLREKPSVGNLRWLTINKANAVKVYEGNYDKREFAGQQAWLARKVAERGEKQ